MKQTNNAIKFLMAQYRAIFRNANLKMFLAAATAAAALAAGSAQAATDSWTNLSGDESISSEVPLSGGAQNENQNGFNLSVEDGAVLTIKGTADAGGNFTVKDKKEGHIVQNGGTINLGDVETEAGKAVSGATVTIKSFTSNAGTLTIGVGTHTKSESKLDAETITLGNASNNVAGPTVNVGKSGALGGDTTKTIAVNAGTLTFADASTVTASEGITIAGGTVTGPGNTQELTLATPKLEVTGGKLSIGSGSTVKVSGAAANTVSFAAGTIENKGGTLDLGQSGSTFTLAAADFSETGIFANKGKVAATGHADTAEYKITLTGSDAVDLGLVLKSDGSALNEEKVNIKTGKTSFEAETVNFSGEKIAVLKNATFGSLTTTDSTNHKLTIEGTDVKISKGLTVTGASDSEFGALVIDNSGSLVLDGPTGAIKAKTIDVGSDAHSGSLTVSSGNWNASSLLIKSGTATVTGGSTLVISGGDVSTKGADGKLVVENQGTVDLVGASKVILNSNGTELKTGGKLVLDQAKSFTIAESDVTLKEDGADSIFKTDSVSVDKSSILQFNSSTDTKISAAAAGKLKEKINGFNGFLQFGDKLTLDTTGAAEGEKSWNDISGSAAIMGANDKVTLKADNVDSIAAVGNVKISTSGTKDFEVKDTALYLTNAAAGQANKFVMDSTGATAGLNLSGDASVGFTSTGEVGSIKSEANKGTVLIGNANGTGTVTVKGGVGVSDKKVNKVSVTSGSTLKLDGKADEGLFANQLTLAVGSTLNATGHEVVLGSGDLASSINGNLTAGKLTLNGTGKHTIAGNAEVKVTELTLGGNTSNLYVGQDSAQGSTGILEVDKLSLNSGSLIIDPEFDKGLAIAHVKAFDKQAHSTEGGKDAQIVNGNIIVGKNSVAAIGFEKREDVMSLLDSYGYLKTHENGSINLDSGEGIQAALVLDDPIKIASGNGVLIDPSKTGAQLPATADNNTFKMEGQGALIINDSVYVRGTDGQLKGAAVTLADGANSSVEVNGKSKVILAGAFNKSDKGVQIFKTEKSAQNTPVKTKFTVETANGIFKAEVGQDGKIGEFSFVDGGEEKFKTFYKQSSGPVEQLLRDVFLGELTTDRNYAGADLVNKVANDKDDHTGVKADAAAHAATYAGAQIAAVAAVGTIGDAVGGRVGAAGVESTAIAATGSVGNGGVWVSPMYKNVDADGFGAQGASYGADVDLAGVAFGADTVNGNMRFGAVFNIGSGDADGKGNGNGLKDEFDYYGFGMYTVMGFGQFALVGDASMNVISHDVSGESGVKEHGKLKGSADTTAVTMGVTGQYTISNPAVDVTPHLGARFIRLDTDSYDLISDKGTVATTDYDVQNVFSIPLGVTLSKTIEMGGWSLAPSADLTLTFNTGDTEVNSNTKFTGVSRNLGLTTEVLDEVTYGVAVGLGAQYGAFGTQIGINYTGSENTDAFCVNANARYMF